MSRIIAVALRAVIGSASLVACGGGGSTDLGTGTGTLMVGNSTFGPGTDPDGYVVTIDGQPQAPRIELNVGGTWALSPGSHSVGLTDLAPGCVTDENNGATTGPNPQSAMIVRQDTALVWFAVLCN